MGRLPQRGVTYVVAPDVRNEYKALALATKKLEMGCFWGDFGWVFMFFFFFSQCFLDDF